MQRNYDNSIGRGLADCQCGCTDPPTIIFFRVSYQYTFANTSDGWKAWMRELPESFRIKLGRYRVLMSHGSPRRMNEFLWDSSASTAFLERMLRDQEADVVLATYTGLQWKREISGDRHFVDVGSSAGRTTAKPSSGAPSWTHATACKWGSCPSTTTTGPSRRR